MQFFFYIAAMFASASEMTYIVSSGALNSTHSLTQCNVCGMFVKRGRGLSSHFRETKMIITSKLGNVFE